MPILSTFTSVAHQNINSSLLWIISEYKHTQKTEFFLSVIICFASSFSYKAIRKSNWNLKPLTLEPSFLFFPNAWWLLGPQSLKLSRLSQILVAKHNGPFRIITLSFLKTDHHFKISLPPSGLSSFYEFLSFLSSRFNYCFTLCNSLTVCFLRIDVVHGDLSYDRDCCHKNDCECKVAESSGS